MSEDTTPQEAVSPAPVDEIGELEAVKRERDEYLAGWQRAKADFINYKRDVEKLMAEIQTFAREDFVYELLPVLDHFVLAESHLPADKKNDEWAKGVLNIKTELEDILKREEVTVIEAVGKPFDPQYHESVGAIESDGPENVVAEEVQRGYVLNGRVLRPAKVKISMKKSMNQES